MADMLNSMETSLVRRHTRESLRSLGIFNVPPLPEIVGLTVKRSPREIVARVLCLHVCAARAFGLNRELAVAWVRQEGLEDVLTSDESAFLHFGTGDPTAFRIAVESIWSLAWLLSLISELKFAVPADSKFAMQMPNIKTGEPGAQLLAVARVRTDGEVTRQVDLAYCLHWQLREYGPAGCGGIPPQVAVAIPARRHALEWAVADVAWDEVLLDT